MLLAMLIVRRKMEGKPAIECNGKAIGTVLLGIVGALALGVGMPGDGLEPACVGHPRGYCGPRPAALPDSGLRHWVKMRETLILQRFSHLFFC